MDDQTLSDITAMLVAESEANQDADKTARLVTSINESEWPSAHWVLQKPHNHQLNGSVIKSIGASFHELLAYEDNEDTWAQTTFF